MESVRTLVNRSKSNAMIINVSRLSFRSFSMERICFDKASSNWKSCSLKSDLSKQFNSSTSSLTVHIWQYLWWVYWIYDWFDVDQFHQEFEIDRIISNRTQTNLLFFQRIKFLWITLSKLWCLHFQIRMYIYCLITSEENSNANDQVISTWSRTIF